MRKLNCVLFLCVSEMLWGQRPAMVPVKEPAVVYAPELVHELETLREAALSSEYAYQQVAYLTENIGARPTGSPQADAAAHHVIDTLRQAGLDARLEQVMVPHWVRGAETAELAAWPGQTPGTIQKVVVTALGGSTATAPEGLTNEVVVVRSFDELKALGKDKVAGKIVLFNVKFDTRKAAGGHWRDAYGEAVQYRGQGAKAAAELGAAASLVRSVGGADYRIPHTGYSVPAGIPAGAVSAEDAELISHLAQQGTVRLHLTLTPQLLPEVLGYNVVADLKGREHPEQVVIVSGHLDSWDLGTGAIDDAAGVAIAMDAVQLMARLHLHPRRTVRVVAWMNEESGLRGGTGYAKAHAGELANHVAAIESDRGAGHPMGFNAKISAAALPQLEPLEKILATFGANVFSVSSEEVEADISPMAEAGVPTFGIMQDGRTYFNYHHTPADTLDKIVPHELQENVAAAAVLAYALANLPEPLPRQ